jgi:hypothetical protein
MVFYRYPSGRIGHSTWMPPDRAAWLVNSFQERSRAKTTVLYIVRRYPHYTKKIRIGA